MRRQRRQQTIAMGRQGQLGREFQLGAPLAPQCEQAGRRTAALAKLA
jgi:hypothetical protein